MSDAQQPSEQRRTRRIPRVESIRVHLNPSFLDMDLIDKTINATSLDVSRGGLKIRMDREVDQGSAMEIWITIEGKPGDFLLRGQANWVKPVTGGGCEVGIALDDVPGTAYRQWVDFFGDA